MDEEITYNPIELLNLMEQKYDYEFETFPLFFDKTYQVDGEKLVTPVEDWIYADIPYLLKLYKLGSEYIQIYQNNLQQSQLSLYPQYLPLSGMMEPSYSVPSTSYRSTTRRNI